MKRFLAYLITSLSAIAFCATLAICASFTRKQHESICRLESDLELLLKANRDLKLEIEQYKILDSLNVAKVKSLELTVAEFSKYRAEDKKLIDALKVRAKDLEAIVDAELERKDTIITTIRDTIPGIISFDWTNNWTDLHGIIDKENNLAQINLLNREELKVIESIRRKRLLGFLWYSKRLETKEVNIVSLNPNTKISRVSYIRVSE